MSDDFKVKVVLYQNSFYVVFAESQNIFRIFPEIHPTHFIKIADVNQVGTDDPYFRCLHSHLQSKSKKIPKGAARLPHFHVINENNVFLCQKQKFNGHIYNSPEVDLNNPKVCRAQSAVSPDIKLCIYLITKRDGITISTEPIPTGKQRIRRPVHKRNPRLRDFVELEEAEEVFEDGSFDFEVEEGVEDFNHIQGIDGIEEGKEEYEDYYEVSEGDGHEGDYEDGEEDDDGGENGGEDGEDEDEDREGDDEDSEGEGDEDEDDEDDENEGFYLFVLDFLLQLNLLLLS